MAAESIGYSMSVRPTKAAERAADVVASEDKLSRGAIGNRHTRRLAHASGRQFAQTNIVEGK